MQSFKAIILRNWIMYTRDFPIAFFLNRVLEKIYKIIGVWLVSIIFFEQAISDSFLEYTRTNDYLTYAVIGLAFHNLAVGLLMNVSRSMISEHRMGTLSSLIISPYSKVGYFLGVFIEQLGRLLLEFVIVLLVGGLFGANIFRVSLMTWSIGIFISLVFIGSMTLLLNNIMLHFRDTYMSQNTLFIILLLVCGVSFPIEYLPDWIRWISHCFPLTQAIAIFRMMVFEKGGFIEIAPLLIQGTVVSIMYLVLGILFYKKVERKMIGYIFD